MGRGYTDGGEVQEEGQEYLLRVMLKEGKMRWNDEAKQEYLKVKLGVENGEGV